ncbi:NAD(P)/FAD-dependent oxidoreductase [Flagellimonas nanhaiensis]|uniref:FAD-binding oxidoreductase n=1 Tax=Flagellimonas nanhaiensis TaxID=2292706 RepID=A0A371JRC0_9FLAO|nr:FAD-binding oxidoreductase [Allomuricauda nanhaiensis]RDY60062.1 FAD-binding oxidoreductase [Allomuricauda nanhaiensis]
MGNFEYSNIGAVVIGAGTIGSATAWHLAKNGVKNVILIDRNQVGTGNTSKAASLMTSVRTKEAMVPLIKETYRNIKEIEAKTGEFVGKKTVGTLHVASSEATVKGMDAIGAIADRHNISHRFCTIDELKTKLPWFDADQALKVMYFEEDSFVDAYVLAKVFADAAKKEGATLLQNTEVLEILQEKGEIIGVKTDKGNLETSIVVDAAGAWANQLSLQVNVPIPMAPVRSIYWITEKNETLFPKEQPMVSLPDAMAYSRPEAGGLLFGLREDNSPHFHPNELDKNPHSDFLGNPEDQWDIIMEHGKDFASFFLGFEDMGIENCITGISTYTPDGYYSFGKAVGMEGFYVAAGCAGAGVAGAGGIGRMISEMILEKELFADPIPFRIDRFDDFDPMSESFRQRCADARSKKKDGG